MLFFQVSCTNLHSTNGARGLLFPTSSLTLVSACLSDGRHSGRCEVIPHCGFDSISLMISDAEDLFRRLLAICISSLEKSYPGPLTRF